MLATRIQIPIKVAYALTIHKSQGMTLKNVIVNCQSCFQPGQLGVAFGRAVSVAGLNIVNLSCCRNKNEVDNRIQILTQGLKLKIQIILHMMLNLLMRILIFQILKLINLENIVDNSGCRVFQLQSLITALENVSLEFMDTLFQKQITDFKQSIISNYK